jgi:DNA primase
MGASRDSLERLRAALNPLEVFREAVPSLKQAGRRWKGLCPFHNERTPSFTVDPERGFWHCFGSCNTGGDVFSFVMRRESLGFNEAVRLMADRTGVILDWEGRPDEGEKARKEREALSALLEEASAFYHRALKESAEGETARRVLAERNVRPELIDDFRLGYAPPRNGFLDQAIKRGVPIERLTTAGLAVRSAAGRYHDPMGDRLCFPILDPYGRVVGFGGRVLGEATGPKYLNSPETPLYAKSRQLYGLFQGRTWLRDRGQAILVEGYMDVVGCHQAGLRGAVAPLGTAFTREQAQLLKRYIKEVVLLYDPDEAGINASWRTAQVLLSEDLFVRVASVPDGMDPDDYAAKKGAGALASVVDRAQDVVDFWLDRLSASAGDFGGLHGRMRRAEEIIVFLRGVPNAILQEEWLKKAAARLSLEESSLRRELQRKGPPAAAAPKPAAPPPPPPAPRRPAAPRFRTAEEETLQFLAAHPAEWPSDLTEDFFHDARCRAAFLALAAERGRGGAAAVAAALPPADAGWWSELVMEEKIFGAPADEAAKFLPRLRFAAMRRELSSLQAEADRMMSGAIPRDEAKLARLKHLTSALKTAGKPT